MAAAFTHPLVWLLETWHQWRERDVLPPDNHRVQPHDNHRVPPHDNYRAHLSDTPDAYDVRTTNIWYLPPPC